MGCESKFVPTHTCNYLHYPNDMLLLIVPCKIIIFRLHIFVKNPNKQDLTCSIIILINGAFLYIKIVTKMTCTKL